MDVHRMESERLRILEIIEEYSPHLEDIFASMDSKVQFERFGYGGEGLHRGYLFPSKILDIVIRGLTRGRIANKLAKNKKPSFIYRYNEHSELIMVRQGNEVECILRKGDCEIGMIVLADTMLIHNVSECIFQNGQLMTYRFSDFNPFEKKIFEIRTEEYTYKENEVIVDLMDCFGVGHDNLSWHDRYIFNGVDGVYSNYTVQSIEGNKRVPSVWDGHVFTMKPRRLSGLITGNPSDSDDVLLTKHNSDADCALSSARKAKKQLVKFLKSRIHKDTSLEEMVAVFEEMSEVSTETEDDLYLFETGRYKFTGKEMFYFVLTKQFSDGGGEYFQVKVNVLYMPDAFNKAFDEATRSDEVDGSIFDYIRQSKVFAYCKEQTYTRAMISADQT